MVVCSALLPVATAAAQEKPVEASDAPTDEQVLAGHSYHGEAFNEGPRQQAYLMGGTGNVHFPVTTNSDQVQQFIDQGVGQLHGFWYFEAERSFRQAAAIDPDCAMAYWGAALANQGNASRAKGFLAEAVKRKDTVGKREAMYIEALDAYLKADAKKRKERAEAYTKALEDIVLEFPDDLEAKAFLALQLYLNKGSGLPITSYLAVDALIQQILAEEPLHPAHHFRIHLWDYRKPEVALSSAARCGQGSPSIAHMWHMPGHIYSRLKRYHDAAWQQEASARVDHAHMMRDRVLPDQIHNFAHNNEWLIRNLIHVGRVQDALDLAKNMTELPRHPKYNTLKRRGSTYYGRLRLFQVLTEYELWDDLAALADTPYLEPTDDETQQVKRLRWLGTSYFQTGDTDGGEAQLAELERRLTSVRESQQKAVDAAEKKAQAEIENKANAAKKDGEEPADGKADKKQHAEEKKKVETAKADARKRFASRIAALTRAVNALKGHQALAAGDAKTAYDLLKKAGDEVRLGLARGRFLAGEQDQAVEDIRREVSRRSGEVLPLAFLAEALWRQGNKDQAKKTLADLRKISSDIDLDAPAFARLAPVAQDVGFPEDWRLPRKMPDDVGQRPDLDTLGPFRWHPSPAPEWTLKDADGKPHSLSDYRGKPLVLIFYLGYGCLHCVEQLHAFDPRYADFEKAGYEVVAIGSDSQASLNRALDDYTGEKFHIQLLSDDGLDTFKAYRAFDDFEQQTLHGTFVIDAAGQVRWQDISYEPFMDVDFVLQEAKRLLAQDKKPADEKAAE
jgi:peroxiredoxin